MPLSVEGFYLQHRKYEDSSSVWSHFFVAKDGHSRQCKHCPPILKTLGGSTKGVDSKRACSLTDHIIEEPPLKRKNTTVADYFVKTDIIYML